MMHYDFNAPGSYSYEQAVQVLRRLEGSRDDIEQQVRRAIFNVVGRNQDDHPKNIAYLMDRSGKWALSPAFDLSYSYNPTGQWTDRHQMSLNGKRDDFEREDLIAFATNAGFKAARAQRLVDEVVTAVAGWPTHAREAGVDERTVTRISKSLRHEALAVSR